MMFGLASKLALRSKWEAFRIAFRLGLIIAVFLVCSGQLFGQRLAGRGVPVMAAGGRPTPEAGIRYFTPIDASVEKTLAKRWRDRARLWPFMYTNLQFFLHPPAADSLYLSILVVPDEFFARELAPYVRSGHLPQAGAPECLVGVDLARAFKVAGGDRVRVGLQDKVELEKVEADSSAYASLKVVDIIAEKLNYQFLRGALIMGESSYRKAYGTEPTHNGLFVYAESAYLPIEELRADLSKAGLDVFRVRYPLLRGGGPAVLLGLLLAAIAVVFQMDISSLIERQRKNIGILRSLGVTDGRLIGAFSTAGLVVQGIGVFFGVMVARYVFMAMNETVMATAPVTFAGYFYHYRVHTPSVAALGAIIVLGLMLRAGRTLRIFSRISPDEMIREGEQ